MCVNVVQFSKNVIIEGTKFSKHFVDDKLCGCWYIHEIQE